MSKVYLVGVGPGGEGYITDIARRLIEGADIVVGYRHALNAVRGIVDGMDGRGGHGESKKDVRVITMKTQDHVYAQVVDDLKGRERVCCILFTGDPDFSESEIVDRLISLFTDNGVGVEIIPGISSVQVAAARSRVAIDRSSLITFHITGSIDREKDMLIGALRARRSVILLPRPWDFMPQHIGRFLRDEGVDVKGFAVDIYENLTLSSERATHCTLADIPDREYSDLCVMVIRPVGR
ncbi:MAG: precorrin-6y C5,15-methyltransferase (decarboxylating) subunit CbiE [Candidatus Nitrosocaldus sp.]|nr:precorrin-6y C5,15-methyltransferase (decarboxylating) subunit CbiE [Candidatus Nitrosocaldus sp.]MDW8275696.1 precorrin-6y C5,15-methyltransferase (decarboxylating) subunit CbiE [Candidatus Nitrosocaldus sp.]